MAKTKQKLSRKERRHELRDPDVILEAGSRLMEWGRKNTGAVIGAGVALLAVLIGVAAYRSYESAQTRDANSDLTVALAPLLMDQYATAGDELAKVAEHWPSRTIGSVAALLAANADIKAAEYDDGLQQLSGLASDDLPPYLRQQAELAKAAALEEKADLAAAAQSYAAAAQMGGPYTADAMLGQSRVAAAQGDPNAAADLQRQVYEQFPERPGRDLLKQ